MIAGAPSSALLIRTPYLPRARIRCPSCPSPLTRQTRQRGWTRGAARSPAPAALDHDSRIGAAQGAMIVTQRLAHALLRAKQTRHLACILLYRLNLDRQRSGDLHQLRFHGGAECGLTSLERTRLGNIGH